MIITEVKSLENIDLYNADVLILPTIYSTLSSFVFDLKNIKNINKKISLKVDKIFEENELEELELFLIKTFNYNIDFYLFSDMAVYYILKKYNKQNKAVYFSKTINCSSKDINEYNNLGIKCLVSTELVLEDIEKIANLENNFVYCYGYTNIFYSKRKLLSLYKDYSSLNFQVDNKRYLLLEETRSEYYPIFENKNGTFISNAYIYLLFEELNSINKNNYFYIDSTFIDEDQLLKVLDIYKKGFDDGFNSELLSNIREINDNVSSGFLYIKPSILKGEQ